MRFLLRQTFVIIICLPHPDRIAYRHNRLLVAPMLAPILSPNVVIVSVVVRRKP